ncbi:MAG: methylenetetrahydrofolate reductase [NAD(P)H], partial [Paludibacteraceae bacterium]|nr:methylenetetrahydrofolate reductase [NAD(P)H] [Paludibacteraceae bacterium]
MTVQNFITNSQKTVFSFEILPPLKGNGIDRIYKIVDKL